MLPDEAAAMIDISTVRTQHTLSDIREAVEYARKRCPAGRRCFQRCSKT